MRILFYAPAYLSNPQRGTPLRIYSIYRSVRRVADVHLVARAVPEDLQGSWTPLSRPRTGIDWLQQLEVLRACLGRFEPELVYGHTHSSLLPLWLGARGLVKTCVDLHGLPQYERGMGRPRRWLEELWHALLLRRMSGITTVCQPLTQYYRKCAAGHTFHGGVWMEMMDAAPTKRVRPSASVIAYCGNLRPYQGIECLLAALRQMRGYAWHFLFVCSSPKHDAEQLLRRYELTERTTLLTCLPQSEVFSLLKGADIAVVPRPDIPITRYAFPSKLPEFLASGAAVISTDVGDARCLVQDQRTGWLIEPGSVEALVAAIKDALDNPAKRETMAGNALKLVRNEYDWDCLAAKAYRFLETL